VLAAQTQRMIAMIEKQPAEKNSVKQKKVYRTPEVISYGTVSDLTAAATKTNINSDNTMGKGATKT
jgi:hypothetical protein